MTIITEYLYQLIDTAAIVFIMILLLILNARILGRTKSGKLSGGFIKNAVAIGIVLISIIFLILSLPIDNELKGEIISFLAIIISAGIALSSTTLLGNIIAGLMNNSMKRYKNGDLVKIGEWQGRIIQRRMFHTEMQLEDSNLVTIPNLYIIGQSVKKYRHSNLVVHADVSLGYDIPRAHIEEALIDGATKCGLKDPYVFIMDIGDFSISYRIHGFLHDNSKYFTSRSLLKAHVIDALHAKRIEIVSPGFINHKNVTDQTFIPSNISAADPDINPEEMVFDKAIKSGEIEHKMLILNQIDKQQSILKTKMKGVNAEEKAKLEDAYSHLEKMKEKISNSIEDLGSN